jgi:hypothetical protein
MHEPVRQTGAWLEASSTATFDTTLYRAITGLSILFAMVCFACGGTPSIDAVKRDESRLPLWGDWLAGGCQPPASFIPIPINDSTPFIPDRSRMR